MTNKNNATITEKKVSYKFQSINGGFSDGVNIEITDKPGTVKVSVDIYGGGDGTSGYRYRTPQKIANYQSAYLKVRGNGGQQDAPIENDTASSLEAYKNDIKKEISARIYPILKEFDEKCKIAIGQSMGVVNQKYGGNAAKPKQNTDASEKQPPPQPRQQQQQQQ